MKKTFVIVIAGLFVLIPLFATAQQEFIQSENIDASVFPEEILTETTELDSGAGIFENGTAYVYTEGRIRDDVAARAPSIQFDEATGEYLFYSNGEDVWDNEDESAYIWTTRPGSFQMTVRARWIQDGGVDWAKSGIMTRRDPSINSSASLFFEYRGAEDLTERGLRNTELAATSTRSFDQDAHESTQLPGSDSNEPIWLRVTRIYPSNQFIFEDSNDGETWEQMNDQFAYFFSPEEMNWGLFAFDHTGTDATFPDAALIDNVSLDPIVGGNRQFSETQYSEGEELNVTIQLNNPGDPTDAEVTETVPEGWAVSNVSDGGSASENEISWSLSGVLGNQQISYSVAPAVDDATGGFSGTVNGIMTAGPREIGVMPDTGSELGDFEGWSNIGGVEGSAEFSGDSYSITSEGNISGKSDSFNFIWKKVSGDFSIQARFDPFGPEGMRSGVMVRDSLAANSAFLFLNVDFNFNVRMQTRDVAGNNAYVHRGTVWFDGTEERNGDNFPGDTVDPVLRIERSGEQISATFVDFTQLEEPFMTTYGEHSFVGSDPVYIGIANMSSVEGEIIETTVTEVEVVGEFTDVSNWNIF